MKILAFILMLLISVNAMAVTCDIPTQINKGDPAPCTGYVMSPETEQKVRTDLVYKDSLIKNLTEANDLQASLIKIQSDQVSALSKEQTLTTVEKVLYFGLGALVTGVAAYGTVRALR